MTLLPYWQFIFAFAFYALFFLVVWVGGVFSGKTPNGSFCKAHLLAVPFYLLANLVCVYVFRFPFMVFDFVVGLLCFFMIQYAIMVNFLGLASRSVSSTLLIELSEKTSLKAKEFMDGYAGGKGFSFVKNNRIENMIKYGLLVEQNGAFVPTPFGRRFYRLLEFVLGFWKLNQIGRS